MANNGPRYQACRGAAGHSCCYDGHVVDTTSPPNYTTLAGVVTYEVVCECDDVEAAILIADALNRSSMNQ